MPQRTQGSEHQWDKAGGRRARESVVSLVRRVHRGGREGGGRGGCITVGWGESESSGKEEKARV